ncbi:hypothetical protein QZQ15_02270 [Serratia marcescens]|uniref:hypothetical protein n=1 Tax=Serratia marcescens TaxID=615 RepID=UPI002792A22A|nr:hypothetical protein [Serratia marcescens]MDP8796827.1 hypothetical protein [Serratia marcescens]
MISSKKNHSEKKSMLADIYGEAIFLMIPFLGLIFITIFKNSSSFSSILLSLCSTTDWSIMSAVIFGQCAYKISRVIPLLGDKVDGRRFTFYLAKRILMIFVSLFMYAVMVFKPNIFIGIIQIMFFLLSFIFFFKDSLASSILHHRNSKIGK